MTFDGRNNQRFIKKDAIENQGNNECLVIRMIISPHIVPCSFGFLMMKVVCPRPCYQRLHKTYVSIYTNCCELQVHALTVSQLLADNCNSYPHPYCRTLLISYSILQELSLPKFPCATFKQPTISPSIILIMATS